VQFLCRLALADGNRFRGRLELGRLKLTKKIERGKLDRKFAWVVFKSGPKEGE